MIYYLVYSSKSSPILTESSLKDILQKSRQNNSALHVTGMLLHSNKKFIQVLEGKKETVLSLYDKIALDPRHSMIIKNIEGFAGERNFEEWSMGYKALSPSDFETASGYIHFSEDSIDAQSAGETDSPVLVLLKKFLTA